MGQFLFEGELRQIQFSSKHKHNLEHIVGLQLRMMRLALAVLCLAAASAALRRNGPLPVSMV